MPSSSKDPSKRKGQPAKTIRRQPRPTPTEEEVRALAYQLFQARGGEPGHELEDWIQAERELNGSTP
jgi:hypothetical protein